jgi:hypothetical protein
MHNVLSRSAEYIEDVRSGAHHGWGRQQALFG